MENSQLLTQQTQQQQIQIVKLREVELAIRLSIFYQNEILVKYVMKKATKGGYDNQSGLVVLYDKIEDVYMVISSSNAYNYITRIIDKI